MSRKQCRRKVWKLVDPIEMARMGAAVTPEAELDKLRGVELAALESFATGTATMKDVETLTAMVNLCEEMARSNIGPEALEACGRAEAAMLDAIRRQEAVGRFGVDGPGLTALRDVYQYHDLQRQSVARSVYEAAITRTFLRVKNAKPAEVTQ